MHVAESVFASKVSRRANEFAEILHVLFKAYCVGATSACKKELPSIVCFHRYITLCLPRPHHPTWKLQRIPVFALRRGLRSKSQLFDFTLLNLTLKDLTEINSSFS